jgi:hypothetical protein
MLVIFFGLLARRYILVDDFSGVDIYIKLKNIFSDPKLGIA